MSLQTSDLTSEVVRPGDEGYDDAARVFFATGQPELVVRPRDPDEVAAAVRHAVRHDLAVSVRSGGRGGSGAVSSAATVDAVMVGVLTVRTRLSTF